MIALGLIAAAAVTQLPIYGYDMIALMARQFGYDEAVQPCSAKDGRVRIAVLSTGTVLYEGKPTSGALAAATIYSNRLSIHGVCLYVEGPVVRESAQSFKLIHTAIAKSNLGFSRFVDASFQKRVQPRVQQFAPSR
jgi:hypothetical protein